MKRTVISLAIIIFFLLPQIALPHESAVDQAAALGRVLERVTCRIPGAAEQELCDSFREKLLKNQSLFNAFNYARSKKVDIIIGTRFYRGAGYVMIDYKVADEQIIRFLVGNIRFGK